MSATQDTHTMGPTGFLGGTSHSRLPPFPRVYDFICCIYSTIAISPLPPPFPYQRQLENEKADWTNCGKRAGAKGLCVRDLGGLLFVSLLLPRSLYRSVLSMPDTLFIHESLNGTQQAYTCSLAAHCLSDLGFVWAAAVHFLPALASALTPRRHKTGICRWPVWPGSPGRYPTTKSVSRCVSRARVDHSLRREHTLARGQRSRDVSPWGGMGSNSAARLTRAHKRHAPHPPPRGGGGCSHILWISGMGEPLRRFSGW